MSIVPFYDQQIDSTWSFHTQMTKLFSQMTKLTIPVTVWMNSGQPAPSLKISKSNNSKHAKRPF